MSLAIARKKRRSDSFVRPMLATRVNAPFDREGWLFEVKWDGYRAIAEVDGDKVQLYSRNQQSYNETFAPITEALRALGRQAVLDGEIVVLDEKGRSQFQLLQNYRRTGKGQLVYYVFDLLMLDGKDLRGQPLRLRQKLLQKVVKKNAVIRVSEHIETTGISFFNAAVEQGLEGIMAKKADSRYQEGARNFDWLKIKTHARQEAVIGGFTRPKGSRQGFGALVLGVYYGDDLVYIGHTGGGFADRALTELRARLEPLTQRACPFVRRPKTNTPARWVKPSLVCEVKFQEWTDDGHMRQPIFLGLREDKEPKAVHREPVMPAARAAAPPESKQVHSPAPGFPLKLTNLQKVYFPGEGITKGDLIDYYRAIAPIILAYLKDRPLSLNRHPHGIKGKSFFQKDVARDPGLFETAAIPLDNEERAIQAPLCQNVEALLYMANLGCIEMNPWNARIEHLARADYLVIDLDPEDAPFVNVVEAALAVRKVLDKAGAASYCKTSGKTGLHIYVPLEAKYDTDQARQFAEVVANLVHRRLPESTSLVRRPSQRQGKVYLDFLQNRRGQTLAAAYSARPYPGATVSTPLKWSEVTRRLDPSRFTIRTLPKRVDRIGDLWQPVLGKGVDLQACLQRLR